jgi:uncharacterized protein
MKGSYLARPFGIAGFVLALIVASAAQAQEPSPTTVALAKELIALKGASNMYDPVIPGVVEQAKAMFLQTNPNLAKDLNDVAADLRAEYAPRSAEISNDIARLYAHRFTEAELKELLTFYRTPLGRKVIVEEPKIIEESLSRVQQWANQFSEEVIAKMRAEMAKKGHNL